MVSVLAGVEGNTEVRSKPVAAREVTATISLKPVGSVLPPGMTTSLELSNPPAKSSPTNVPRVMPSEIWVQVFLSILPFKAILFNLPMIRVVSVILSCS